MSWFASEILSEGANAVTLGSFSTPGMCWADIEVPNSAVDMDS